MHPAVAQSQFQDPYYHAHPALAPVRKHSGFGIASFTLAILFGLFELGAIITAGMMEATTPGGMDEDSAAAMVVGLAVCGGTIPLLIGFALGIVGVLHADRIKTFGIVGLIFNAVVLLCLGGLMMIGMAVG